ncbi:ABC transporter permease [Puia dinghuensis]|uniref:ABC transporter permease n=1 Tax=Puia dinghuensis TaxID=1792502 RepID=A0A8J2UE85_9BACT|nr:ABC transporter permease [Puia dinghuensis]GGB04344.1 ABC transporter permease [Puia dinghuensis]
MNFLKITFRNLWKNRSYSFLNIFGLAIGVACAGLIFLWVEDELSYDQSLPNKDRLYYVMTNQTYEGKVRSFRATPVKLAPAISQEVPGIAAACRVQDRRILFSFDDKALYEYGAYADSSIFRLFNTSFVAGNARDAFRQLTNIVITERMSRQLFGQEKAIGKVVKVDNKEVYTVSAVIRDFPENSTVHLDWMIPYAVWYNQSLSQGSGIDNWGSNSTNTYVELSPGTSAASVNRRLYDFIQNKSKGAIAKPFLFSAKDWHLRDHFEDGKQTGGRIEFVRLFVIIAWIILFIACINFMNLATARSDKRSKEVGVRKVLGAERKGLIGQFIGEALVLSALSMVAGVLLIALVMPAFDLLVGKSLHIGLTDPLHLGVLSGITLLCGLVAGSYPALYLSSFNPIFAFKGIRMRGTAAALVRKGLVVMQFTVSIVLIISTVVIYRQIEHIRSRDLGYDRNNLMSINVRGKMADHFYQIRQDLLGTGVVENAALNSFNTLWGGNNGSGVKWEGKPANEDILISYRGITPGFLATSGMQLAAGRDFRQDLPEADSMHVLVTENLAKMMGKGSAVGKRIWFDDAAHPMTVVGVVKDFVFDDMYGQPEPVLFFSSTQDAMFLYTRLKPGAQPETALAKIEGVIKKDNPGYPFEYSFVNDDFNALFRSEMLIGQLSRLFAALAVLISCLGLFGLSAYMAERRVKEIGIRKVLGAGVPGLAALLSREFLQLVLLATVIAFPLAWMAMSRWLDQYHYRIGIEWWVFGLAGLTALGIALATVSFQAVRAALANPALSLRSE